MINLLPPEYKETLLYNRRNRRLLRWITAFGVGILGSAVVVASGLFYINQATNNYAAQVAQTETDLNSQKLPEITKRVEEISSNLKLVVQVLQRQILFSKLFKQVGAAIPSKASLTGLSIAKVSGAIDLSAVASDYTTATQVQVNLKDPANKIFDKADIVNVTCSASSASDAQYPCSIAVKAEFTKNNPFLFINTQSASTKK